MGMERRLTKKGVKTRRTEGWLMDFGCHIEKKTQKKTRKKMKRRKKMSCVGWTKFFEMTMVPCPHFHLFHFQLHCCCC